MGFASVRKLASAVVVVAIATLGCAKPSSDTAKTPDVIKIGHFAAMTGATASFGQSADKGIRMAIDEINAAGGVLGKQIEIITEDDRSQSNEAKTAAIKLIQQDKVVALIGEVASSNSLAAAPDAQRAGIPMVSPASTNPDVTKVGDYIFRICFIDPFQGEVMAKFGRNSLGLRTAAIFTDVKSAYSVGLAEFFKNTFTELGGEIVAEESYAAGDIEFRAQLTKIRNANAEILFIPGYYTEIGLIAKQARELGIQSVLLGGDGWDGPATWEIGGAAVEGSYFSNHYSEEDPNPVIQDFIARFRAKFNAVPDAMAVLGYDTARVVVDAIKRAGSTDGAAIRDALAATKDFPGVSGTTTIDADRNARKAAVVLKIQDGKLKYTETVNPS
jgi:branched-chain amino acid transport system substrate-binding protein